MTQHLIKAIFKCEIMFLFPSHQLIWGVSVHLFRWETLTAAGNGRADAFSLAQSNCWVKRKKKSVSCLPYFSSALTGNASSCFIFKCSIFKQHFQTILTTATKEMSVFLKEILSLSGQSLCCWSHFSASFHFVQFSVITEIFCADMHKNQQTEETLEQFWGFPQQLRWFNMYKSYVQTSSLLDNLLKMCIFYLTAKV